MNRLSTLYERATKKVIAKIYEDIMRYFEWHSERIPELNQYYNERKDFLEHTWFNIWTNIVTSDFSIKERRQFLIEKGISFETTDKKLVKKLFRDEIKKVAPFNVQKWLFETFSTNEWEKMYKLTKEKERERIEKEQQKLLRKQNMLTFIEIVKEWIKNNENRIYLHIRYKVALQLKRDLEKQIKYKLIGRNWGDQQLVNDGHFSASNYRTVEQFFSEFTGDMIEDDDWGRLYFEYETYGDCYYQLLYQMLIELMDLEFQNELKKEFEDKPELMSDLFETGEWIVIIEDHLEERINDIYTNISNEYIDDMLEVANIDSFQMKQQHEFLQKHQRLQEQRRLAEELERKRKQEEEQRIMKDVFEREMVPRGKATHYILHIGDTNTGKTFHALEKMKEAASGCYLAPLRLLALEVYEKLNEEGVPCSLKTGEEEKIIPASRHISCTVEMFSEKDEYDCIVIDEAQMIADRERGFSWYQAITGAIAKEVHIIGSKNTKSMFLQLLEGDVTIYEYNRDTPLKVERQKFTINQARKGDALICFSRRKVLETAGFLERSGKKVSMIYGSMPPETRKTQIDRFINGNTSVIVATDAIGMGLNLPIRRIVFLENEKFDGVKRRRLTSQEVKQIAGRAGRKGLYNVGKVAFSSDIAMMKRLLEKEDPPLHTFTISPTNAMLERFQKYSHHLGTFFAYWNRFENPNGTIKAVLSQEQELYQLIQGTNIEARLSLMDLYSFLHLPFSAGEKQLVGQWIESMTAIVNNDELPEPIDKRGSLDEIELTYKSIGLYLLFLYRLGRKTEATYWERIRKEVSDEANDHLRRAVKKYKKKCRNCGRKLPFDYPYGICSRCYENRHFFHY